MRVVVLGAGSLGSLYGAWFARQGADVVLVARPRHATTVRRTGLRVRDLSGAEETVPMDALDDAAAAPPADLVLLASKAHDTRPLLAAYRGTPSVAFSVQNGVGQAEPLAARFGPAAVACVSMAGATLEDAGLVVHTFTGTTYVGDITTSEPGTAARLVAALAAAAPVALRSDIAAVLWSKAVLAVGAMGVPALTRLPYHRVFQLPGARAAFLDLVADAAAVAAAEGVELADLPGPLRAGWLVTRPREDALAALGQLGETMEAAGQTAVTVSMLQSVESGRPLEVQAVFSELVTRADHHGLAVPALRTVTRLLESIDAEIATRRAGSAGRPVGAGDRR